MSKSTLSLWLRDVPLTQAQQTALDRVSPAATRSRHAANRAIAARRRAQVKDQAGAQISRLSESELFVAGVVAYWAEGTKNKPWRNGTAVQFVNSDAALIRLFLAWLGLLGVSRDRFIFRLHIHESADAANALAFWSKVVGAPPSQFAKPTIKTHTPKTVRKNVGEEYHGCLVIYVRNSATLNLQIEGWCQGLSAAIDGPTTFDPVSGVV